LAFGPRENRDYFFRTPPELLYGELPLFERENVLISLARNESEELIDLVGRHGLRVRFCGRDDDPLHEDGIGKVYARSMALIERPRTGGGPGPRISVANRLPRPPRGLRIQTEGEVVEGFVWPAVIVGLAVVLTYLITDFAWQCSSPIRDTLEELESS
jgi:hypothetical protein